MLKTVEDLSATKKRLNIEIPTGAIESKIKDSLEKVRQKAKIPGFRPGKTPMNIIEKHFGKSVEAEAVEKIIPEFYEQAIKEAGIVPVSRPVLDGGIDFRRHHPLSLVLTVEIRPKIEDLDYTNIQIKDTPIVVSDPEIDTSLERMRELKATYEIADKEIETDDLITVDYEIRYDDQTMSAKDQVLKVGVEGLPKEITESLKAKKAGETVEVEVQFPEDFHVKNLAGKKASVKNIIKAVKKKNLPAVDNEFAKDMGFENLEGLRVGVKVEIEKAKKEQVLKTQRDEILEKLVGEHDFDVPDSMLEKELSAMVNEVKAAKKSDKDEAVLRAELRPEAVKTVKVMILLSVIGEKEGITVTDEELKEKIIDISQRVSMSPESLMKVYIQKDGSLDGLRNSLYGQKVMDFLVSKATQVKGE